MNNNITPAQLNFITYSRKSTENIDRQVASIDDQNTECRQYAFENNLSIVHHFEEAKSAYKPNNRPEFKALLELIISGKGNAILTWKLNRLARNPKEGGALLQLLQDGILHEIRTPSGEIYTSESDHLILQIHFGMANQYSRNISKDVKRALYHKVRRGEYFRKAPRGYENYGDSRGKRNIRPHPEEANIVREVFTLASEGYASLESLSKILYANGIRTKFGKALGCESVRQMLMNTVYYGYFVYKGELFEGNFEPLISKDLYEKVQSKLKDRSKVSKESWDTTYNGLIECVECGCSVTTTIKRKYYKNTSRTAYYGYHRCTHKRNNCKQPQISTSTLENQLINILGSLKITQEQFDLGLELLEAKSDFIKKDSLKKSQELNSKVTNLDIRLSNLIEMRANKELSKEEFIEYKNSLIKQKSAIKEELKKTSSNWIEPSKKFLQTCYEAQKIIKGKEMKKKKDLLKTVGSNYYLKNRKVTVEANKPYDVLLESSSNLSWQGVVEYVANYYFKNKN